jgi:hypothetical protein
MLVAGAVALVIAFWIHPDQMRRLTGRLEKRGERSRADALMSSASYRYGLFALKIGGFVLLIGGAISVASGYG